MIVLAREVFVCKCSTALRPTGEPPPPGEPADGIAFRQGSVDDLARLDPEHHSPEHVEDLRDRLSRGEYWLVVEASNGQIPTYTWLHTRHRIDYPYLAGCSFTTAADVGYGYDAWTHPSLRGGGCRRRGFIEELRILRAMGMAWEASFFVKHQLEGATRSLSGAGIDVIPVWRAHLGASRELVLESLRPGDSSITPRRGSEAV